MNKNNSIKQMQEDRHQIFGVDIRAGGKLINLPVYEGDTSTTVVDRLYKEYPRAYNNQCREAIKNKVTQQLERLLASKNISIKLRERIQQFLKKSQIGVKIVLRQQSVKKSSTKHAISKKKCAKKQNIMKGKQNKQSSLQKSFTKLYQIKKSLKAKKAPELHGQNQQNIIKMFEKRQINRKAKDKKLHIYKQDLLEYNKENQTQVIKRIEQKIKSYQKCKNPKDNMENNICLNTQMITIVAEPLQEKKNYLKVSDVKQSQRNFQNNTKNRFKYNYDEIISDRKMAESAKKQNYSSRRKYSRGSDCEFSRCYDNYGGNLKYAYKQQCKNNSQKYSYSIQQQFSKSLSASQIRENSENHGKQKYLKNAQLNRKSLSKLSLRSSTVFRAGDSKQSNLSFKQQPLKRFKYL